MRTNLKYCSSNNSSSRSERKEGGREREAKREKGGRGRERECVGGCCSVHS